MSSLSERAAAILAIGTFVACGVNATATQAEASRRHNNNRGFDWQRDVAEPFRDNVRWQIRRQSGQSGANFGHDVGNAISTAIFGCPNFQRAYREAIHNTPALTCETHVGADMTSHLNAVLQQANLADYAPLVRLAFRKYNAHVLRNNSNPNNPRMEMVRFQRDTQTGACYINGDFAAAAFHYYNGIWKNQHLPQFIPDPEGWGNVIHNAHGYTRRTSSRPHGYAYSNVRG
ncbi:MAG: hypothetical protein FWF01_00235 [Alphaproteobacteria bacterium]|nr:hypothetical protein [Alphaproteobacteria bacterium]